MDRGKEKFYRFGTFVESLKFMTQMHISYSSINRNVKTDYGTVQGRYEPGISILGDCLLIIYDLALLAKTFAGERRRGKSTGKFPLSP